MLVLIGTAVFLLGWLGNVTVGIWFLRAGVEVDHLHPAGGARDARGCGPR